MDFLNFKRVIPVKAARLGEESILVKTGAAKAGDWLVLWPNAEGEQVVTSEDFAQNFLPRGKEAKKVWLESHPPPTAQ